MSEENGSRAPDLGAIGQLGLQAASSVVEQILSLSRRITEVRFPVAPLHGDDVDADGAERPPEDPRRELRRLRADAERMIELYGDWTRSLLDGMTTLAEAPPGTTGDVLSLGPVGPGEVVTATVWLHTFAGPVAGPAVLHATALTLHDGSTIPGDSLAFDPPVIVTDEPDATVEVTVTLTVPATAAAGAAHGWILARGLPEVALPVSIEVGP